MCEQLCELCERGTSLMWVGAVVGRAARGAQGVGELWDGLGRGLGVGVASDDFKFCRNYDSYFRKRVA